MYIWIHILCNYSYVCIEMYIYIHITLSFYENNYLHLPRCTFFSRCSKMQKLEKFKRRCRRHGLWLQELDGNCRWCQTDWISRKKAEKTTAKQRRKNTYNYIYTPWKTLTHRIQVKPAHGWWRKLAAGMLYIVML